MKNIALLSAIRSFFQGGTQERVKFEGNYLSWIDAQSHATGYDNGEIFRRVRDAALKVKRGDAVFERDGVCFYHEEYRWEVLAGLLLGACECGGRLNVLDFGGALGGFYFQHRKFFSGLTAHRWGVIEQKHYVECGRSEFENEQLKFYSSVDECISGMQVNIILLSSVIQYLEKPYDLLNKLSEQNANYIIVDRTPFIDSEKDLLVIQRVPESIFPATIPTWIFSEGNFENTMNRLGYFRSANFSCAEERVGAIKFCGILYRRGKS